MRAAVTSSIPKVGIRIRLDHALSRDLRSSGHAFAPIPECSSALTATTSAATAAFTMVYSDVIGCESVSVTTVAGNLDAGTLAAAVSARERENGMMSMLLVGIAPPLPFATFCIATRPGATSVTP